MEVSTAIGAPPERVCALYADYRGWPNVFPTISAVRALHQVGNRITLAVSHVEGHVVNELVVRCPDEIDLWEVKRRYDALFRTRFLPAGGGTLVTVVAHIRLSGWPRLLQPVLRGHIRRQIRTLQLNPLRRAAAVQESPVAGLQAPARDGQKVRR